MDTGTSTNSQKDTLKSFLKEEIESIRTRLQALKGKLHEDDFQALDAELNERSQTLDTLTDADDTQLFILRREIAALRENTEALATRRSWWSRIPFSAKVAIFTAPFILYFVWLSLVQWRNQGQVYDYPSTQTAVAAQTALPTITAAPVFTPTATP